LAAGQIISAAVACAAEQKGEYSISAVAGGYAFEGTQHLKTAPVFGGRAGYSLTQSIDVEALFDYADTEGTKNRKSATMYRFGADMLFNIMPESRFSPNLAAGISGISVDNTGSDNGLHAAWSYGAGIKYFLSENVALRADVRHIIYNNDYSSFNNLAFTVGVHIPFGAAKTSGKAAELPPPVPAIAVAAPSPQLPAAAVSPVPAAQQVIVPALSKNTDSDGDGVRDSLDRCPNTPPGTAVDSNGCPGAAVPEQKTATAQRFCNKPAVLTVSFDSGKADIKAEYFPELGKVGAFLKEFPASKGTIEGHTDSSGSNASNIKLSQLRAESVRTYLINSFGIKPDRIAAVGYGPAKPVAPNTTPAGKAKNRRIETVFSCE